MPGYGKQRLHAVALRVRMWDEAANPGSVASGLRTEAQERETRSTSQELVRNAARGRDILASKRVIARTSAEVFTHVLAGIHGNNNLTMRDRTGFARLNVSLRDAEARCASAKVNEKEVERGIRDVRGVEIDTRDAPWSHEHWDKLSLKPETTHACFRFTIVGVPVYPQYRVSQACARAQSMCVTQAQSTHATDTLLHRFWVFLGIPDPHHPEIAVVPMRDDNTADMMGIAAAVHADVN